MPAGDPPLTLADLDNISVTKLKGVGDKKAKSLAAMEIGTVLDLLTHYPRRYIDRTNEATIADLHIGEEGMVLVTILNVDVRRTRNRRTMVNVKVGDHTGKMTLTFFNQPWRAKQLEVGREAIVFGKLTEYRGTIQMANPLVDFIGDRTGKLVPVYPQSEKGASTHELSAWVDDALRKSLPRGFAEPLPPEVRSQFQLTGRERAFAGIHAPETHADIATARKRLVFDELLRIQLRLVMRKRAIEASARGVAHNTGGALVPSFIGGLLFPLTGAQTRVIDEINTDLASEAPMHRLLQGDVGAGKTLVAVAAMLAAVQGGHQAALMAPTEVLAEQHHLGIGAMLDGFIVEDDTNLFSQRELRVELLSNAVGAADRKRILADLASGTVDVLIGTHALIQDGIEFASLGVVVIDEQHRFGVDQRAALREKGRGDAVPDVLVMTATPIPRTAAMTVYGDLDVSVLDELPPGRTPIETQWVQPEDEADVWQHVREQVDAGHQAYVVCPLIELSDKLEVRSAEEVYDELTSTELPDLRIGLLHGRLSAAEKDQVMTLFRDGALDVMVATTVIEVGVDVPNATVMVIIDADRFGIAQLHQLRGRVGRGKAASQCFLVAEATTPDGEERLEAMVRTTDGFELAEVDLELRGEGTIMGDRQKGRNDLKLASLRRDREWVAIARDVAFALVDSSPDLAKYPALWEEVQLFLGEEDADYLLKS